MRAPLFVSSVAGLLASGCAVHAPRPATGAVAPPARGVGVVLAAGDGKCRLEVERLPPAAFALGMATVAREEGRAGALRAVAVELDATRPVLVLPGGRIPVSRRRAEEIRRRLGV